MGRRLQRFEPGNRRFTAGEFGIEVVVGGACYVRSALGAVRFALCDPTKRFIAGSRLTIAFIRDNLLEG